MSSLKNLKLIRGSGGGNENDKGPTEATNTLFSKAFGEILDLICEGEIEGLVNGAKSIYLDETVLENSDGTRNFKDVTYETRNGTQAQSHITGSPAVENEQNVGVIVTHATPLTRQITNANINAVRVRISTPTLSQTDPTTGNVTGNTVLYKIYVQANGGGFVQKIYDEITGKSTSKYERSYKIALTGSAPWDVRVERYSLDDGTANVQSTIYWESYTEVIDAKLRYPNSALCSLKFDASQFRSMPARAYELKLLRVRVPTNYTASTRTYTGVWDGTFQIAWTDNPAWVLYDLLTSSRYGLGRNIVASQIDKWGLYTAARYCDEMVSDGFGGSEPRFACNVYLSSRNEAFKVLQDLASSFRAMIYWAGGSIVTVQDSPSDSAYIFNNANVVKGDFTYQGASLKTRHTVALVTWNDPEDFYRQKVEYVEDQTGIARFGIVQTEIAAFGCASRGQAHRLGKWLLYTNQYEGETVSFKTGLEGAIARPGQIINIVDAARAGTRFGGRVTATTANTVTIDSPISENILNGTLYCVLPDGTLSQKVIQSYADSVITLTTSFVTQPNVGAVFGVSTSAVEAQTFRVLSVTESLDGTYDITGVSHDPAKFDFVENDLQLEPRTYSILSNPTDPPTGLKLTESLYESQAEVRVKLTFSWDKVPNATGYLAQYQLAGQNFIQLTETQSNEIEILDVQAGVYIAQVTALNALRKRSGVSEITKEVFGKTTPPAAVQNFSLVPIAGRAELTWTKATDLDVLVGGTVRIRWTPNISAQSWANSVDIVPSIAGSATRISAPLLAGTYIARFIDSSGVTSTTDALVVTTVPTIDALNVVNTQTETGVFSGTKTNCAYSPELGGLCISSSVLIDSVTDIGSLGSVDFPGPLYSSASYAFASTVDLGAPFVSNLTSFIKVSAFQIGNYIDSRTNNVDDWTDVDGANIDDVNAVLYMRTTLDNPSGSPTWTDWKPFFAAEYNFRGAQFRLDLTSGNVTHNILIEQLSVTIDLADTTDRQRALVSGTTAAPGLHVIFADAFYAAPSVGVTAQNMSTGDYSEITSMTETGFFIVFKNTAGTVVSRTFDMIAKGYGRNLT